MKIHLIQGEISYTNSKELIAQMTHSKIFYHDSKINDYSHEEDVKKGESKLMRLQNKLN